MTSTPNLASVLDRPAADEIVNRALADAFKRGHALRSDRSANLHWTCTTCGEVLVVVGRAIGGAATRLRCTDRPVRPS